MCLEIVKMSCECGKSVPKFDIMSKVVARASLAFSTDGGFESIYYFILALNIVIGFTYIEKVIFSFLKHGGVGIHQGRFFSFLTWPCQMGFFKCSI
jgi:hypothetical protein